VALPPGIDPVVIAAGVVGVALAARRCHSVAPVMLATVAARPPLEWLLKEIVQRPRPSGARLVAGTGFAYPSGHVLAAAATWGFVPLLAGLYIERRWVWWALTTLAWRVIGLVAWSRVWLGVHWTFDVIGGLAIGFVALSLAEHTLDRRHADTGSSRCTGRSSPRPPPVPDQPPLSPNRIAVSGPRGTHTRSPTSTRSPGLDETNANSGPIDVLVADTR
jgi:PAP2 superfamily